MIFLIKPHSFIDVITNSSSELFVVKDNKTIETVIDILNDIVNRYNDTYNKNNTYNDIFGEIVMITEHNVENIISRLSFVDPDIPDQYNIQNDQLKLKLKYKHPWDDIGNIKYNHNIGIIAKEEYDRQFKEKKPQLLKKYLGTILISSVSDNSIPYEMFDIIEDSFENVNRYHV